MPRWPDTSGLVLPALILFLTFFFLLAGIVSFFIQSRRPLPPRLRELKGLAGDEANGTLLLDSEMTGSFLDRMLKKIPLYEKLQALITQADVKWQASTMFLVILIAGGAGFVLGLAKWGLLGALGGGALGLFLPYKVLGFKKKRRYRRFERQLPDALDLLARSLKAGHAFPAGLQLVAREMSNPIGSEFFKTYKEYSHGLDLNNALINLCQRIEMRDLQFFTTAVLIQRETGGNLTEILEKIAALIRDRFKLRNQIRALTAEGRLSGLVLVLLPPAMAGLLFFINPAFESLLVKHPAGRVMALAALGFQILGIITIRKIVNIKV